MGRKEIVECDGRGGACGKVLRTSADGVLLRGSLRSPGGNQTPYIETTEIGGKLPEIALCWGCLHALMGHTGAETDSTRAATRETTSGTGGSAGSGARDSSEPWGNGMVGPMSPPELGK